jgi:hypothetical protein
MVFGIRLYCINTNWGYGASSVGATYCAWLQTHASTVFGDFRLLRTGLQPNVAYLFDGTVRV